MIQKVLIEIVYSSVENREVLRKGRGRRRKEERARERKREGNCSILLQLQVAFKNHETKTRKIMLSIILDWCENNRKNIRLIQFN